MSESPGPLPPDRNVPPSSPIRLSAPLRSKQTATVSGEKPAPRVFERVVMPPVDAQSHLTGPAVVGLCFGEFLGALFAFMVGMGTSYRMDYLLLGLLFSGTLAFAGGMTALRWDRWRGAIVALHNILAVGAFGMMVLALVGFMRGFGGFAASSITFWGGAAVVLSMMSWMARQLPDTTRVAPSQDTDIEETGQPGAWDEGKQ